MDPSEGAAPLEFAPWSVEVEDRAARSGKPLLLYVRADWCAGCRSVERMVLPDPRILEAALGYVAVQVDVTEDSMFANAVMERFGVERLPCLKIIRFASRKVLPQPCLRDLTDPAVVAERLMQEAL